MHIIVTGASGFIGRALCAKLLNDGHTLTLLTRSPENTARLFLPHKISAISNLDDVITPVDAVINLAGEPIVDKRWTASQKKELINSRLHITQALVEKINAGTIKPRVFISGSAIGFYGDGGDQVLDEHSSYYHEEFAHTLCKQWEEAALAAQHNARVCIVRIGIVLDEGGGALQKMLLPFRLGLGGKMGSGQQWFSWVHREDLVNLIIFILNNETCSGIFNGTAPKPVTNEQFTKTLGATLKRPTLFAVPSVVLGLLMGERADLLLKGQHVLPTRALAAGFSFKYPELELALKAILK